jgi:hypothetical protein
MAFTIVTQGSFISEGLGIKIPVPSSADYFVTTNLTQMALAPTPGVCVRGEWYKHFTPQNDGLRWKKDDGAHSILIDNFSTATASGGFTYVEKVPFIEAPLIGTTISQANGAVFAVTNSYSNGDRVRIYDAVGMHQIDGMDFTISSVSGSGFTALGLDSSGFASAATSFVVRRISKLGAVEPRAIFITAVTRGLSTIVRTSTVVDYVVGQKIHFTIPSGMGMPELNQLTGTITAVGAYTSNANYNLTVDIDSTNFSPFAFPASTAVPTAQLFATFAPAGQSTQFDPVTLVQTGYDFVYPPFHTGQFTPYMYLAGGAQSPAGAALDRIIWQAYKMENS